MTEDLTGARATPYYYTYEHIIIQDDVVFFSGAYNGKILEYDLWLEVIKTMGFSDLLKVLGGHHGGGHHGGHHGGHNYGYSDPCGPNVPGQGASTEQRPCPKCNGPIQAGSKFCPSCGASVEPAACKGCGEKLPPVAAFCPGCGTKV